MAKNGQKELYKKSSDNINYDGTHGQNNDVDDEVQVDLLRGTEKYQDESEMATGKKNKWGVAYYKQEYPERELDDDVNPNEQLVQDVSSTAVLTPLDDDLVGEVKELEDRGNWSGRFDFLMSLLGYSVGLGNVWRFPYLAYSNGGGAFVFPFVLMLLLLGIPLMFLELSLGQYAALGPSVLFDRLCPLFHGIGYGMISVSGIVSLYYTVIIGWCILYLFTSFTSELPWEKCHPEWASEYCYSYKDADACHQVAGQVYYKQVCYNATVALEQNISLLASNVTKHAPAQDFFERGVLDQSGGIEDIGIPQWKITLCLLCAWIMTFAALSKGVKSTGKVVYFTALFPYVVLFILFFRGVTLPGAADGIIYYLTPRFDKLGEAKVWSDAAAQIFFALSPAWGGLITLSSYNQFHNNCFKDSLIVGIGNICTSIFAGFVIFSIIGYLAHELQMPIDKVVDQGAGLAFIVYPDVVTRLPISPLWSILFFVMMITLGMGSEFALLETMMTAVQDTFPQLRAKKTYVVAVVCFIGFLGGLSVTCNGGVYILQLMDNYVSSWSVFLMAGLESVMIGWIYGADRFIRDIEMMIGVRGPFFHRFFTLFWKFLSPLTLIFVFLFNLIQYKPLEFGDYVYPMWSNGIGWILSLIPIIFISTITISKILKAPQEKSIIERVKFLLKPSPAWGPAHKVPTFDINEPDEGMISNPNFSTVIPNYDPSDPKV
ncbi:sodium- and chloride-dependent glycine transporter 1-like isoform X2 [Ostrea edulis]|uniref:sodium- and chloride-dependent glycine transporter 1-like isoform X2 n=1 Tax=Ostrea edulis TaxID=37623 RepID=UPI0020942750|nr:sodium- and chloride-dependent glycine transporter 1-like isoform X2 [Ostrea edulis]